MSAQSYTITDSPIKVVLGEQQTSISLLNQGPSTVYLSGNSAVDTINGLALPPMGQMSWHPENELWAVCASGNSTNLLTSVSAGKIDANRSKFWVPLSQQNCGGATSFTSSIVECSHCNTIQIQVQERYTPFHFAPPVLQASFSWFDNAGNLLYVDGPYEIYALTSSLSNPLVLVARVPVIGSSVQVTLTSNPDGSAVTPTLVKLGIYGSDRLLLPISFSCLGTNFVPIPANSPTASINTVSTDAFTFVQPTGTYTDLIYFANLGSRLSLSASVSGLTAAGIKNIRIQADSTPIISTSNISTSGTPTQVEGVVPVQKALTVGTSSGLAGTGNLTGAVTFQHELR